MNSDNSKQEVSYSQSKATRQGHEVVQVDSNAGGNKSKKALTKLLEFMKKPHENIPKENQNVNTGTKASKKVNNDKQISIEEIKTSEESDKSTESENKANNNLDQVDDTKQGENKLRKKEKTRIRKRKKEKKVKNKEEEPPVILKNELTQEKKAKKNIVSSKEYYLSQNAVDKYYTIYKREIRDLFKQNEFDETIISKINNEFKDNTKETIEVSQSLKESINILEENLTKLKNNYQSTKDGSDDFQTKANQLLSDMRELKIKIDKKTKSEKKIHIISVFLLSIMFIVIFRTFFQNN